MNNTSRLLMLFLQHAALLLLLFQSVIYESYGSSVVNVKIFRLSDSPGAELLLRYVAVFFDRYRLFVPPDWPSLIAPI